MEKTYPDVLPLINPQWLSWNDNVVYRLATSIYRDRDWRVLPVLADALEEAGCTDTVMLLHLRSSHNKPYSGACWCNTCWLLNHLLCYPQPVMARFRWENSETYDQARVINPGECQGSTWLVFSEDCYSPPLYIVEAESVIDAIEVYVDSEHGEYLRVHPGDENDNETYGLHANSGDIVGGHKISVTGWYDLRGDYLGASDQFERPEPNYSAGGHLYDDDNVRVFGEGQNVGFLGSRMPFTCYYIAPGLPFHGISPLRYHLKTTCRCGKTFYPETESNIDGFCCLACALVVLKD